MAAPTIRVVGHYCHDTLIHPGGKVTQALGGSSSYISSVWNALKLEHEVIAKVGGDFLYDEQVSHPALVVSGAKTTHFEADFTQGERILRLLAACPPITPADISGPTTVTLACGIHNEIQPETLDKIAQTSRFVLCDTQGFIRSTDHQRRITHRRFDETPFAGKLGRMTLLKASEVEARELDLDAARQVTTIAITRGSQGCTLIAPHGEIEIASFDAEEIDVTGAGDCWMAGFGYGMALGMGTAQSARLANFCGALAVGQIGIPILNPEVLNRAIRAI